MDQTSNNFKGRLEHQELQTKTTNLQKALDSFIEAADMVDQPPSEEQMDRIQQNIDVAQEILFRGINRLVQLSLFLEQNSNTTQSDATTDEALQPRLAPLPIPKFRGQLWEWDHFWSIFEAVIHKSNISRIEKLSYLLEALQGPAMDTVKELQVTADNYDVAIQLLRRKYDNQEAVISQLLQHLQDMRPRSATIADQMHTLDKILPVVAQREQKGENTNTQQMQHTILSKFNDRIQRSVLRKKAESADGWSTKQLLKDLQDFFEVEAQIQNMRGTMESNRKETIPSMIPVDRTEARSANNRSIRTFPCFYCNDTNHTPRSCPKYTTIEQRLEVIKRRNLCHNCGSGDHRAKDCTGGACRQCNEKGHHTSICRKAPKPQAWTPKPARNALPKAQPEAPAPKKKAVSQNFAAVVANQSSTSCRIGDHVVLCQ
ncbi:zinc knuckle [Ostertagia ostertagi]